MAIVEELKKIGGGTGSTIEEALATGDFGGGGGSFIVTITGSDETGWTSDKSFAEIRNEVRAGKIVECYFWTKRLYMSLAEALAFEFSNVVKSDSQLSLLKVRIPRTGAITVTTESFGGGLAIIPDLSTMTVSQTYAEIKDAYVSGKSVYVVMSHTEGAQTLFSRSELSELSEKEGEYSAIVGDSSMNAALVADSADVPMRLAQRS